MGFLFQQFVKTFCERETDYRVSAPRIAWFGAEGTEADLRHLPGMQTDIVLRSPERTIIVDTKFYTSPLDTRFGVERAKSGHLYQIFAYVTNWAAAAPVSDPEPEGWLLYAAVDGDFDYRFELMGRSIRVCSIDLAQEWREIEGDLKELVHLPVERYYHPDEFADLKARALALGFRHVESGPLVRSSYHAHEQADACAAAGPG